MAEGAAADGRCKVGRVADRRGLDGLDDELVRRREAGESLRALADAVNRRVLAGALEAAGVDDRGDELFGALAGERAVEAVYDALAGEAEPARTARVRTRLEQHGVDVDALEDDWVTHPTVRRHLRECLGVDTAREPTITAEDAVDTVEWARARAAGVVERTFERLHAADLVRTSDLDVTVTLQLTCAACGNTYRPRELLDRGGCACEDDGTG